jgi:predicted RNase H-like nuclease (RuvC/YqgF family)
MSTNGPEGQEGPDGWARLESSVEALLARNDELMDRARTAESRIAELETALEAAHSGAVGADDLRTEVEGLRGRNRALEERMSDGRARVRQIAERLRLAQEG